MTFEDISKLKFYELEPLALKLNKSKEKKYELLQVLYQLSKKFKNDYFTVFIIKNIDIDYTECKKYMKVFKNYRIEDNALYLEIIKKIGIDKALALCKIKDINDRIKFIFKFDITKIELSKLKKMISNYIQQGLNTEKQATTFDVYVQEDNKKRRQACRLIFPKKPSVLFININ